MRGFCGGMGKITDQGKSSNVINAILVKGKIKKAYWSMKKLITTEGRISLKNALYFFSADDLVLPLSFFEDWFRVFFVFTIKKRKSKKNI